ncbi:MAG TPA: peptidylprolyl isomerase [Planctomycetota bacterium]|jgi:parvulin-like peptidyl-prolyl isomerase
MKLPMKAQFSCAAILTTALLACASAAAGESDGKTTEDKNAALLDRIPMGDLGDDKVILQSGDIKIPLAAVERVELAYAAAEKRRNRRIKMTDQLRLLLRKQFAFRFLANAVIEKHAADQRLEIAQAEFETQFEKFRRSKQQEDNAGSYEQWLADNGMTDEEFRRFWRANFAIEQAVGKLVTDDDVQKVLAKTDALLLRRAAHILVIFKGDSSIQRNVTRSKEDAKAAAEEIIKKLKAGEDFAALAKESSDCPSADQGGVLGWFPRDGGASVAGPRVAEAIYKLEKPGDFTQAPVESAFGYHVIKLLEIRQPAEMKDDIHKHLVSEKYGKQIQQLVEEAAKTAKYNQKLLLVPTPAP